jgi:hypothetical protein
LEEEESAGFAGFLRVLVGGASWGRELVEAKMEAVILLQPVKNLIAREHGTRSWLARKCGTSLRNSSRNMQQQMFGAVGGEQCRFAPLMGGLRRRWQVVVVVRAFSNNSDSRGNNNEDAEAGWESTFEIEVPSDQRPVRSSLSLSLSQFFFSCCPLLSVLLSLAHFFCGLIQTSKILSVDLATHPMMHMPGRRKRRGAMNLEIKW